MLMLAALLTAAPAAAQQIEVAAIAGYTTAVTLDTTADGVDELTIDGGMTWGARGTYFLTSRFGVEAFWNYQRTDLTMSAATGSADLFEMTIQQIVGNVVYRFGRPSRRVQPFVAGGAGAAFFSATDLDSDTRPAWNVGGGVTWLPWARFGVEGRVRYESIQLHERSGTEPCGPFDFCQGALRRVGITGAIVARF
jgi:hypothetical protein